MIASRSQPAIFSRSRMIVKWKMKVQARWMILKQDSLLSTWYSYFERKKKQQQQQQNTLQNEMSDK